jgi:hypothetical protein
MGWDDLMGAGRRALRCQRCRRCLYLVSGVAAASAVARANSPKIQLLVGTVKRQAARLIQVLAKLGLTSHQLC